MRECAARSRRRLRGNGAPAIAEDGIVIGICALRFRAGALAAQNAPERIVLPDDAGEFRQRIGLARRRATVLVTATGP